MGVFKNLLGTSETEWTIGQAKFLASSLTAARNIVIPNASGTLALSTDLAGKVNKSGDTMSGPLDIEGTFVGADRSALHVNNFDTSTGAAVGINVTSNDTTGSFTVYSSTYTGIAGFAGKVSIQSTVGGAGLDFWDASGGGVRWLSSTRAVSLALTNDGRMELVSGGLPAGSFLQLTTPGSSPGIIGAFGANLRGDIRFGNGSISIGQSATSAAPTNFLHIQPTAMQFTGLATLYHTSGVSLVIERTNSPSNSSIRYEGNAAVPLFAGLRTTGVWSVGPNPNLATTPFVDFASNVVRPGVDNAASGGDVTHRYTQLFAVNTTVSSSDARLKTPKRSLTPDEIKAGVEIAEALGIWQWLAKVEQEGENARFHCGHITQEIIGIMWKYQLKPMTYSFICYDRWDEQKEIWNEWPAQPAVVDETGTILKEAVEAGRELIQEYQPAGDRFSLRYEGLAMFCLAALAQQRKIDLENQQARLKALEDKLGA